MTEKFGCGNRKYGGSVHLYLLKFPLVGVLTVPSTLISLVGDNTNHREIGYKMYYFN